VLDEIVLKEVSFSYRQQEILKSINLTVKKGEFLGIIGPNGAGKTTLLKLILGILQPSQGEITVLGQKPTRKIRQFLGYMAQKMLFDPFFPISVRDVIVMGLTNLRMNSQTKKEKVENIIREFNLQDLAQKPIGELSGGQQQKVFLGQSLVRDPQILLLDEPTTNLDFKARNDFYDLIKTLRQKRSFTILAVSHDILELNRQADYLLYLEHTLSLWDEQELLKNLGIIGVK